MRDFKHIAPGRYFRQRAARTAATEWRAVLLGLLIAVGLPLALNILFGG